MPTTPITFVGNLVEDPEVRFTPSGTPVCSFRVASTPSRYDREKSEWVDGEATFLSCNVWRDQAENVGASLSKGDRVVVTGRLITRSWETNEGDKRYVHEIEVEEVAAGLRYATATVTRRRRADAPEPPASPFTTPSPSPADSWGFDSPAAAAS